MKFSNSKYDDRCQERYNNLIRQLAIRLSLSRWPFVCACIGECFGTVILILFGLGCSAQKTLGNYTNTSGFLSLSINWGIGLSIGLFASGVMGAGLMNPALTLAFAIIGKVRFIQVIPYTLCQFLGGWIGTLLLLAIYNQTISLYATKHDHGLRLMNDTGAIFITRPTVSHGYCLMDEIVGTSILAGMALAIGDKHNFNVPRSLQPLYIGLLLSGLLNSLWINCGAAFNPARDLGPRIALLMCGWGTNSFRDSDYYFWVPIVGPYVGALAGAVAYELLIGIHLQSAYTQWKKENEDCNDHCDGDDNDDDDDGENDETVILPVVNQIENAVSSGTSVGTNTGTIVINYDPE